MGSSSLNKGSELRDGEYSFGGYGPGDRPVNSLGQTRNQRVIEGVDREGEKFKLTLLTV